MIRKFYSALFIVGAVGMSACKTPTNIQESTPQTQASTSSLTNFASNSLIKGVKINLNSNTTTGSFDMPAALTVSTPIPTGYPGATGVVTYNPGVNATRFFSPDSTNPSLPSQTGKPGWLRDFQMGMTQLPGAANGCATLGGAGNLDVSDTYRVSERDCTGYTGTGTSNDLIFLRAILNRDTSQIGAQENLLVQIEYQASALRLNSDGISTDPEDNLDQLWKIFWNSSLDPSVASSPFAIFIPPNFSNCITGGFSQTTGTNNCTAAAGNKGAPIKVRQFIIPLSAYPNLNVIQFSRVKGRINAAGAFPSTTPVNYVSTFCSNDSPLCLGTVIYSVTLMRI